MEKLSHIVCLNYQLNLVMAPHRAKDLIRRFPPSQRSLPRDRDELQESSDEFTSTAENIYIGVPK